MHEPPSDDRSTWQRLYVWIVVLAIAVPFFLRLPLLESRGFNPDELEHLHWSWCVSKGMVPDRDYFDHHTPWLHFFMAPFFSLYATDTNAEEAIQFIFMARRMMWGFSGILLVLVFVLGNRARGWERGLLAVLLLTYTAFFLTKSLEFRPAVPAAALLVGSVLMMVSAFRRYESAEEPHGAGYRLFASGLLLGAATMFTQKVLFVGPGFAAACLWFVWDRALPGSRRQRFLLFSAQSLGYLIPIGVTLVYFAWNEALSRFVEYNFLLNARWPGLRAGPFLVELAEKDLWFLVLVAAGLVGSLKALSDPKQRMGELALLLPVLSLWVTLPLHPGMSYQHFLLILPLSAIYAADGFSLLLERAYRWAGNVGGALLTVSCLGAMVAASSMGSTTQLPSPRVALVAILLAAVLLSTWRGLKPAVALFTIATLGIVPLARLQEAFSRGNWGTLQAIRYVLRNSAPWETTFDGFTGLGLFRPQAFFHHFQHPHAFALQSEEEHRQIYDGLRSGAAVPKFIFWSHYLRDAVTPEIAEFLEEHYVPIGLEPIRVRPFDNGAGWWLDEDVRYLGWVEGEEYSPHLLFDDAWRQTGEEFGLPVRRTRTRRSSIIVPIRYPRDFMAVFRAHADPEFVPFGVELVVNGAGVGVRDAVARWQDYAFEVPVQHLRPGFNTFELRFSGENDDPSLRWELAVYTLQLVRSEARE